MPRDGVIMNLNMGGIRADFFTLEGMVDHLASIESRWFLVCELRHVAETAINLAQTIEALPQEVENE